MFLGYLNLFLHENSSSCGLNLKKSCTLNHQITTLVTWLNYILTHSPLNRP